MAQFEMIAFDADDTLWHNERLYASAQARFKHLLMQYHDGGWIEERLYQTEINNLKHFGYGIKSFALSMIETAVELTEGRISGQDIRQIIQTAKEMLGAEVELLPHVAEVIPVLAERFPLMVITKGDLLDQESKMARSGLAAYFQHVEVVSDKTEGQYARLLEKHGIPPHRFLMVGNSLRSDVLPVLALGGSAVHVPHAFTWAHEEAEPPLGQPGFHALEHLGLLPGLLDALAQQGA